MNVDAVTMHVRVPNAIEAAAWYERFLERPPDFVPFAGFAEWELTPGCWLQLAQPRPRPTAARVRFGVADLRHESDRIRRDLGVTISEVQFFEDQVAWCDFADPYDNPIGLVQDLTKHPWHD